MKTHRSLVSLSLVGCMSCALAGLAPAQVFTRLETPPPAAGGPSVPGPRPLHGWVYSVDGKGLGDALAGAPVERMEAALRTYGRVLELPGPAGGLVRCVAAQSPVMEPPLQARFPQIQTYLVEAVDGSASGRIELAPRGLTGMLRTTSGQVWMIDLWQSADSTHVVSYWLSDLPGGQDWACQTTAGVHGLGGMEAPAYTPRTLQTLRTFRLAMACTGEWGLHQCDIQGHSPNVADPLAGIVTVASRANVVYEADLAVHLSLVANNDQIVYINPDTDPYSTTCDGTGGADCSGAHLAENISNLSSVIGNSNFDIGQLLTRIYGGVAYLSSVCSSSKAGGISGIPRGGDIDPFSALVPIHEMGHQFGANHTFSGTRGRCAGNVNLSTAWEAGSGSSPMAYAGGCPVGDAPPSDNVAIFADPFFHHGSYGEMVGFLGSGAACAVATTTANNIPVISSSTPSRAIPPGTPFALTVVASDTDGEALTYSWEEYDSGVARPLSGTGSADNGAGALFRVFPPVTTGTRTFPRMADVLSGVPTPGEQLPTVTGVVRQFRVMVRDNHPGAGGVAVSSFTNLSIPNGTSPFAVLTPTAGSYFRGGTAGVTWSVGGTAAAPISCATVTIRLSTDGGATFPLVLGTFPNNGSATVTMPAVAATGRIRIDGDGQIFFAVSRPFGLRLPCTADFNHDGDQGTDADIEDFFACLSGSCCAQCGTSDFDGDGDVGTDADIEAFFRVLAGGAC